MILEHRSSLKACIVAMLSVLCMSAIAQQPTPAQQEAAARLLESVASAMGGRERLQRIGNFAYTGFGQQIYQDGGGNSTADVNAPPKWRAVIDAQRTFDLKGGKAVHQERRSLMFPLAAPFGHDWSRVSQLQTGATLLDHPLPAILAALDPATRRGTVTVENGLSVVQFMTADGTAMWMGVNPGTLLPAWTRRITPHVNLGDVAVTAHFTGYVPYDGVQMPLGLVTRIDWRNQITMMFQVDSYRIDIPASQLPVFPAPAANSSPAPETKAQVSRLAKGVWDVRTGSSGGPVVEFDDHLVMFEAYGSAATTLARIDAANQLVAGKRVSAVVVTHHHFDHTSGLRAAVSRGLTVISHRGNEQIIREMVGRPAVVFPDDLAKSPRPLTFTPVDERLVLQDKTQRLEIYHVLNHSHMANAVFAYLPEARIMMEGDLGDEAWTWHWWAGALAANLKAYNINPRINVAVHGPLGGLSIEQTLANNQKQSETAQKFCTQQREAGMPFFGCPVQYDAAGALPLSGR
jgi:Metallo-beta-lactamase superfamily